MIELNLSKSTKITDTQRAYSLSQWGYELEMADIFRSCNDKDFSKRSRDLSSGIIVVN